MPTDQVGDERDELDRDDGQQEADGGLRGEYGADESRVRRLAERGGEDARVGDDGGTPYQQKDDENGRRGGEEDR